MKKAKIVIGSNYGDEGKGLTTHFFANEAKKNGDKCLNVLFNGGCQRGHTVEIKETAIHHVFHHFGAGTLDNADTYFDEAFIVNPMVFIKELYQLQSYPFNMSGVHCYISPLCRVSTIYDMILNQLVEKSRGDNKHGSCGLGIYETRKRYDSIDFSKNYRDLVSMPAHDLSEYLKSIRDIWFQEQVERNNIRKIPNDLLNVISSDNVITNWISDFAEMRKHCEIADFNQLVMQYDTIIFEGAQGLALDEFNIRDAPYLTPSRTTSQVPMEIIKDAEIDCDVEICYVTRSYFTRHGRGPLPTQCSVDQINPQIIDSTNIANEWQGYLRYGKFDKFDFIARVMYDQIQSKAILPVNTSLFVTQVNYTDGDICGDTSISELQQHFDKCYVSASRFADDIEEVK